MKTNFKALATTTMTLVAMSMLAGCGGGGVTTTTNVVATDLAKSYTVEIVEAPVGAHDIRMEKISPNGEMVGSYQVDEMRHLFRYKNGVRTDITDGAQDLKPTCIGNDGTIGGSYDIGNDAHPFSVKGSKLSLPTLPDQAVEGWVNDFTAKGEMITSYEMMDGTYRSTMTSNGTATPIQIDGWNNVSVNAVSPAGWLAASKGDGNTYTKHIFNPTTMSWTQVFADTPTAGIRAINDSGSMVGLEKINGKYAPFVVIDGTKTNPSQTDASYSAMVAINSGNVAIGQDQIIVNGSLTYRAFGWSPNEGYVNLNDRIVTDKPFVAAIPYGIDNQGRIVGYGHLSGVQVGFILTPVKN